MGEAGDWGGVNVVPPSDLTECQETAKMENQHLRGGGGKTVTRASNRVQTTTWGFKSVQKQ